jgi:CTP synthase (UTP-ammonia lyase)
VTDVTTSKALSVDNNEFIQSMHHRSWIVQIGQLKNHRRTDLEKLLSIFDQDNRNQNHHILNIEDEDDFPEAYRSIIRRLRMASESEDMQIEMEMEDDYLKELQDREREIARKDRALEETVKALEEKEKTIEEKDRTIEEKDRIIEELRKQLAEGRGKK